MSAGTDLTQASVLFAFGASLVYLVGVSLIWPRWRRSLPGRAMVSLDLALFFALLPSAIHQVFGVTLVSPFFAWYYRGSLVSVGMVILWRLWVVWHEQRRE